jgi:hypothetical protein
MHKLGSPEKYLLSFIFSETSFPLIFITFEINPVQNILIMKLFTIFSFCLILSFSQSACGPQKNLTDNGNCSHSGVIKDFTGLDGCRLMIADENGKKLLPVEFPELPFTLKDGQKVRFSYKEAEAMSICMAEDMIVDLTCFEIINKPGDTANQCIDISEPMKVEWMQIAINDFVPEQVVKYEVDNQWLYLFKSNPIRIMDCYGVKICDAGEVDLSECMNFIPKDIRGEVIWQREYKND